MSQREITPTQQPQERQKKRLSLSFRVSLLLMIAAIVPLLITLAYIEKAVHLQTSSSQKLATAIKVNTQVNEQLTEGATGTNSTAAELEQVVNELRQVVGR